MRAKQIRFIGYLSVIFVSLSILNSLAMLFFFGVSLFSLFGFFIAFLFYIIHLLNQQGNHFLAKSLILLIFNFAIVNISSSQGIGSGSILLYFPLLSLYFLIFETYQWRWIIIWTFISCLGYYGLERSGYTLFRFGNLPKIETSILFQFNLGLSFIGELLIMLVFIRVTRELEKSFAQKTKEAKASMQDLLIAKENAERAAQARSLFLSSMSHEIRTPINSIIGFTHLLLEDELKEEQKSFLSMIDFSSKNLLVIINDILEFNKMEAGKVSIERIPFDFFALMENIYQSILLKTKEKNLDFVLNIHPAIPNHLIGDPTRLSQILFNLLSNAVKFTSQGNISVFIDLLKLENKEATIRFVVKDTGIGIPNEKQETIFDQFTQADSSTTRKYGGTGLGLSIVKKLIELHGSRIQLQSEEGIGSEFSFDLLFSVATSNTLANKNPMVLEPKNTIHNTDKLILVVDDNDLNLKVAYQFIKKCGYECRLASSGREALKILESEPIVLVLMDLQMPDWDGFVTTKIIREKGIKTPIVALTADVAINVTNKVKDSGFVDIIYKPFQPKDLMEKLKFYLF